LEGIVKSSGLKRKEGLQSCLNAELGFDQLVAVLSLYKTQNYKISAQTYAINLSEYFSLVAKEVGNGENTFISFSNLISSEGLHLQEETGKANLGFLALPSQVQDLVGHLELGSQGLKEVIHIPNHGSGVQALDFEVLPINNWGSDEPLEGFSVVEIQHGEGRSSKTSFVNGKASSLKRKKGKVI